VDNYARVADSIVGWSSKLGPWSRLENHAVVGEDVTVRPEVSAGSGLSPGQGADRYVASCACICIEGVPRACRRHRQLVRCIIVGAPGSRTRSSGGSISRQPAELVA